MLKFSIGDITLSFKVDNAKMESYGIPGWMPSVVVDKTTEAGFAGAVTATSAFMKLSEEARNALLTHEAGHVACGHLELTNTDELVINAQLEAEADDWACSQIGDAAFDWAMDEAVEMIKTMVPVEYHDSIEKDVAARRAARLNYNKD